MSYHLTTDWRNKPYHQLGRTAQNYNPMFHSIASYCTETKPEKMDSNSDLNELLQNSNYINHLRMLTNPLQKNLADDFPENPTKTPARVCPQENREIPPQNVTKPKEMPSEAFNTTFGSIGSFISGVFSVISSAMPFQRRPKTPDRDLNFEREHDGSPPLDFWLTANPAMQNKNNCRDQLNTQLCPNSTHDSGGEKMSSECHSAAVNCEGKLNEVRMLLVSKPVAKPKAVVRPRRPKKVFVEPNSVEEGFADAFTPEDFVRLSSEQVVECVSPYNHVTDCLAQIEGAKMKTKFAPLESTEIAKPIDIPVKEVTKDVLPEMGVVGVGTKNGLTVSKEVIISPTAENVLTPFKDLTRETTVHKEGSIASIVSKETVSETLPNSSTDTKTSSLSQEVTPKDTIPISQAIEDPKTVIIQSCEDKVSRLKALLQERRKNNSKTNQYSSDSAQEAVEEKPEPRFKTNKPINIISTQNKHYKNPNRLSTERRTKSNMRKDIRDDMLFANEVDLESSSVENSPKTVHLPKSKCVNKTEKYPKVAVPIKVTESPQTDKDCYFNEISGRFRKSSTTESEDSFQIVFTDSPQLSPRTGRLSDCDSEDSFIIFEDVPDSCYTTADVFSHSEPETDFSDYDTDDSDRNTSGKLSHNLSRTISDLTDDSLYKDNAVQPSRPYSDSEDEVDSAVKVAEKVDGSDVVLSEEDVVNDKGLLLNAAKKLARKGQPPKKVRFSSAPPRVLVMRVWAFAARQARAGHWEQHALDRERFKRKIADVDMAVSWVLKPQHRNRVKFQRFMPWWHAERRRELAEKKEREAAEEKRRLEEEARRLEEERRRLEEEEERRIAAEEEEKRRVEKERLKAEEKRLTEMNRKRMMQNHLKSEAQRAAEVSMRRSENERKRKEEEKYRLEAKLVAEEMRKKIEEEIARLAAEKAKLERDIAAGIVTLDSGIEENIVEEAVAIQDNIVENNIEMADANVDSVEKDIIEENGKSVDKDTDKEKTATNENQPALFSGSVTKDNRKEEQNPIDSSAKDEKTLVSEDLKSQEKFTSALDNKEVSHNGSYDKMVLDNSGDSLEINGNASVIDKTAVSKNTETIAEDCNANPAIGDNAKVNCLKQKSSVTDTDEIFVDCVDKIIVADDKRGTEDFCNNNNTVEQENITANFSTMSEIGPSPESSGEGPISGNIVVEKTEELTAKIGTETTIIEDANVTQNESVKTNKK